MVAIMRDDGYVDITPGFPYEIDKVYQNGRFRLKNSPRQYRATCFKFYDDKGKEITFKEAYKLYRVNCIKAKLGMK
jgi:hypothetical protein